MFNIPPPQNLTIAITFKFNTKKLQPLTVLLQHNRVQRVEHRQQILFNLYFVRTGRSSLHSYKKMQIAKKLVYLHCYKIGQNLNKYQNSLSFFEDTFILAQITGISAAGEDLLPTIFLKAIENFDLELMNPATSKRLHKVVTESKKN